MISAIAFGSKKGNGVRANTRTHFGAYRSAPRVTSVVTVVLPRLGPVVVVPIKTPYSTAFWTTHDNNAVLPGVDIRFMPVQAIR